jgi:hypothetical protein
MFFGLFSATFFLQNFAIFRPPFFPAKKKFGKKFGHLATMDFLMVSMAHRNESLE